MKKRLLSLSLSIFLFSSNANASGIPTVDIEAIAQAVLQYNQMLRQYEQMIKDSANQLTQMKEQGIGMNINEILGDLNSIVDRSLNLLDYKLDDDIFEESANVINICSYLEEKSSYFKIKLQMSQESLKDQINTCLSSIGTDAIEKSIGDLTREYINSDDEATRNNLQHQMDMLRASKSFLDSQANSKRINAVIALYDSYISGDVNNPYSKAKSNEDLKKLANRLKEANNQKQAVALTNALLLKLLELSNRQYELSLNYYTMVAGEKKSLEKVGDLQDLQEKIKNTPQTIDYTQTQSYRNFISEYPNVSYDDYGMPDFLGMTKVK